MIRVRGGVRVRDGVGDGFRFRVSVRSRGGLSLIHFSPNLLELKLHSGGGLKKKKIEKKNKQKKTRQIPI